MADVIREVEMDPEGGVVVTIEEGADHVEVPPPCAGCLGEPTKRLPPPGLSWIQLPYCDACVPPVSRRSARKAMWRTGVIAVVLPLMLFVSLWLGVLGLLIFFDLHGPRGTAVKLLHSESGSLRLAFRNDGYARLFVEANGGEMLPDGTRLA